MEPANAQALIVPSLSPHTRQGGQLTRGAVPGVAQLGRHALRAEHVAAEADHWILGDVAAHDAGREPLGAQRLGQAGAHVGGEALGGGELRGGGGR